MTIFTTTRAVNICNNALIKIGQDPIEGFDQNPRAEACNVLFDKCLEAVLKVFAFEFSKKTTTLTKFKDKDGYSIPPKMITALGLRETCSCCEVCEAFHLNSDVGIVITDNALYINKPINCGCGCECDVLVYTSSDYDTLPLSPLFDKALISLLSSDLAIRFSGNTNLSTNLFKEYVYWCDQAKKKQSVNHTRVGDDYCEIPFFKCKKGYLL